MILLMPQKTTTPKDHYLQYMTIPTFLLHVEAVGRNGMKHEKITIKLLSWIDTRKTQHIL